MIFLWRGHHHPELPILIQEVWDHNDRLLLISPTMKDFSFVRLFNEVKFVGDWVGIDVHNLREKYPFQEGLGQEKLAGAVFGIFTSGTQSGFPRLIFYTKENVESSLKSIRSLYDTERIKKIFCFPQPTHTFGFVLGYLHCFLNDLELIPLSGTYSKKMQKAWFEHVDESTLTLGTPSHFIDLISYGKTQGIHPRRSYSAIVGGAPVTKKLWGQIQADLNIECPSIGYGATEASPGVMHLGPLEPPLEDGDIGCPLEGVRVELLSDGVEFSGPNVCHAIFDHFQVQSPERIKLKDLITKRDGHYFFQGRSDLVVNRGGIKISLERIENLIHSELGLKCLAVDLYDVRLGIEIFLLVQSDEKVDLTQVKKFLLDHGIKISKENIFQNKIPLNSNLKFDRNGARKFILSERGISFPFSTHFLKDFLPHRAPIIWVDELLEVREKYGKGLVRFNPNKTYASEHCLRQSSCIEFVAQCYGYSVIVQDILKIKTAPMGQTTLILEIKNVQFSEAFDQLVLKEGDPLMVEVWSTYDFGQLKILKGKVSYTDQVLAELEIKAFVN